jgi:hypothetical protein
VAVIVLVLAYLPGFADPKQLALEFGLMVVASLLVVLYGQLTGLAQIVEIRDGGRFWLIHGSSYLGCATLLGVRIKYLPRMATDETRLVIGMLLLLSGCMAMLCLGSAAILARSVGR